MKTEEKSSVFRKWLKRNFLTGILVLIPIIGTIFLFNWVFRAATDSGLEVLKRWEYFGELIEKYPKAYGVIGRLTVVLGLFGIVGLVGFLARNLLGRKVVRLMEKVLENIPLINRIFIALKQISGAFIGSEKSIFSYVVLFEYPRKGIYALGFAMSEARGEVQARTKEQVISIFLPTTPNPTSGMFVIVPKKETLRLSMTVEEALKMIISGGAVVPPYGKGKLLEKYGLKEPRFKETEESQVDA